jgi:ubiquinone/menaquinone biosynthesis C-methylase UbiE
MKILEIGPGTITGLSVVFPGADTVDGKVGNPTSDVLWGQQSLPFANESYDLVFASHVLEHVPWYRTNFALKEAFRVLTVGGELEIYVPDFAFIVDCYSKKRCGDNWRVFNDQGDWMTWVNGRIFTYGEDAVELLSAQRPIPQTHHKAVFDFPYLKKCLHEAGFSRVIQVPSGKRRHGQKHSIPEAGAIATKT